LRRTDATRGATDPVTLQIKSLSKSGANWGVVGLNISAVATPNVVSTSPRYQFFLITDNGTDWKYQLRRDANNTLWTSSTFTLASLVFPIRLDAVRNGDNYDFKVNGSTVVTGSSYTSAQHDSLVYYHMTWSIGYSSAMTATVDNFGISAATPTTGFAAWQATNGTAGTLDQDHDADGVPNGIEYFLGGNTDTTGFTALPPVSNNSGVLSVTWTKAADYAGNYGPAADFVVQTSDTLTSWSPVSTSGTPNTPDTVYLNGNDVTYTFPSPLGAKKFARLKVTGP
jgi:hypothetical protein